MKIKEEEQIIKEIEEKEREIEKKKEEIDTLKDILFYDLRGKREIEEEVIVLSGIEDKAGVKITIGELTNYVRERKEAKLKEKKWWWREGVC